MNKLITWCEKRHIVLSPEQYKTEIKFNIKNIYSFYRTKVGIMFCISTNKGEFFLHLYNSGGFKSEEFWDGGDLTHYYNKLRGF